MSLPAPTGQNPVWITRLLWPKLRRQGHLSPGRSIARIVFVILGLGIAAAIYLGSAWFLQLCFEVEAIGPLLCRRLLDLILLALLSVLLLSNVISALSSFFLSEDLELLLAAPVPLRTLFGARFAEQLVTSSWMVLAFGLPTLMAFARVTGTPLTYLAIAGTLLPLLVYPAAAGVILTLLLVRFMPAARARDLVVALVFVAFVVLYITARLAEPERLMNPEGFASLVYLLTSLSAPSWSLLPSHWATVVVGATMRDAAPTADWLLSLAALWTGAGALHVAASALFRSQYTAAFSRSQEGRQVALLSRLWARIRRQPLPQDGPLRSPGRRAPRSDWARLPGRVLPPGPAREFLIKDIKLLLRDASQWSQLVLLLALVFVYLYNFRHLRQIGEAGIVGPLAVFMVGMALCGFVTTAVSVRFAFPLISLEGRMLWLLRAAPVRPALMLRAKLISTLPPLLIMAEAMAAISSVILEASPAMLALASAVAGLNALSVAALATGLGAVLPDFKADSAARVAASFGGLVCMIVALGVALALVGLAFYPAMVLHHGLAPSPAGLAVCILGAAVVTGGATLLPMWLGARALLRYEP